MGANNEYLAALEGSEDIDWKNYTPPKKDHKWRDDYPEKKEPPVGETTPQTNQQGKSVEDIPKSKPKSTWRKVMYWGVVIIFFFMLGFLFSYKKEPETHQKNTVIEDMHTLFDEKYRVLQGNIDNFARSFQKAVGKLHQVASRQRRILRRIGKLESRTLNISPTEYETIRKFYETPLPPGRTRTLTIKGCQPEPKKLPLRRN